MRKQRRQKKKRHTAMGIFETSLTAMSCSTTINGEAIEPITVSLENWAAPMSEIWLGGVKE